MEKCKCYMCENNKEIVIPKELIIACENEDLVFFAGAGISTEGKGIMPQSLYSDVFNEMNKSDYSISFSNLMEEYCSQPNGRIKLIKKFSDRLDYVKSYAELNNRACAFHRELSTIHCVKEVITTNWDNYFEEECGCASFVFSEDFALNSINKRKVYKIHGSISNYGSIIATKSDYDKCYENLHKGLIGSKLKLLLSSSEKKVVFIGYSLEDEDFQRILKFLDSELGNFVPHYYVVSLDENIKNRLDSSKFTVMNTDGTYFVHQLKQKLIERGIVTDDLIYSYAAYMLESVNKIHVDLSKESLIDNPENVYNLCFQDGLIHSYQRTISMKSTGYYSKKCNIHKAIKSYEFLSDEAYEAENYIQVAYIDGYIEGLMSLYNFDDDYYPSLLYLFNEVELNSSNDYKKNKKKYYEENREKYEYALKIAQEREGLIFHHTPFL